jgi:hypothetical protein
MPPLRSFENGQDLTSITFAIAVNHPLDKIKDLAEEFIIMAQFSQVSGGKSHKVMKVMGTVYMTDFVEKDGYAYFECMVYWPTGDDPKKIQIFYRSLDPRDSHEPIPLTPALPLDFWMVSWNPDHPDRMQILSDNAAGKYSVASPISTMGRWHLAHPFADIADIAVIYLWRFAAPAYFEMHSHIESNHCSPLPPAYVHIWDASVPVLPKTWGLTIGNFKQIHPSYSGFLGQDTLAPIALGEGGKIGKNPTAAIGAQFGRDLSQGDFHKVFAFLSPEAAKIGCLMPMDMEYMHFNAYFGVPVSKTVASANNYTGQIEEVRWFCWDKLWEFETNNQAYTLDDGTVLPPRYAQSPPSEHGEVWNWMSLDDRDQYEKWKTQIGAHSLSIRKAPKDTDLLPFYHFDPRRYTIDASSLEDTGCSMLQVKNQPVQAPTHAGEATFFGYKLYTALGWAPMDPYLGSPLREFYAHCQEHQIPVLNHGTPAGYYSHDRRHYFDRLWEEGKIVEGNDNEYVAGWTSRFSHSVVAPDGSVLTPKPKKDEHWWSHREEDRVWWFTHHYVSAQSWRKVLETFPTLKLCLAHFGDSDHLRDNSWGDRMHREPHREKARTLTIGFDGARIDKSRTHRFLYDLLELIQPENHVFADLSYVILNKHNAQRFTELFHWARDYKPILLERILWGTDWPLIGGEDPVTGAKGGNMLHRYAKGFRDAAPKLPGDFFLRACFLNPLQYLDLKGIRSKVGDGRWEWTNEMDDHLFQMSFQDDKVDLLYKTSKSLAKMLES